MPYVLELQPLLRRLKDSHRIQRPRVDLIMARLSSDSARPWVFDFDHKNTYPMQTSCQNSKFTDYPVSGGWGAQAYDPSFLRNGLEWNQLSKLEAHCWLRKTIGYIGVVSSGRSWQVTICIANISTSSATKSNPSNFEGTALNPVGAIQLGHGFLLDLR